MRKKENYTEIEAEIIDNLYTLSNHTEYFGVHFSKLSSALAIYKGQEREKMQHIFSLCHVIAASEMTNFIEGNKAKESLVEKLENLLAFCKENDIQI